MLSGNEKTNDKTPVLIASTASPYKFSKAVLQAVKPDAQLPSTEFEMVDMLNEITKAPIPAPLASLKDKKVRFNNVTEVKSMPEYVLNVLGIK